MDLLSQFNDAVDFIKKSEKYLDKPVGRRPTVEEQLKFYALYKQAKNGRCDQPAPWIWDYRARKKWDAWEALRDMPPEVAMQAYVQTLDELWPTWRVLWEKSRGRERGSGGDGEVTLEVAGGDEGAGGGAGMTTPSANNHPSSTIHHPAATPNHPSSTIHHPSSTPQQPIVTEPITPIQASTPAPCSSAPPTLSPADLTSLNHQLSRIRQVVEEDSSRVSSVEQKLSALVPMAQWTRDGALSSVPVLEQRELSSVASAGEYGEILEQLEGQLHRRRLEWMETEDTVLRRLEAIEERQHRLHLRLEYMSRGGDGPLAGNTLAGNSLAGNPPSGVWKSLFLWVFHNFGALMCFLIGFHVARWMRDRDRRRR